tara:strand:+ start:24632 stop:25027 length:396 start_codon:yes stop_codon:yes gene_type:complete
MSQRYNTRAPPMGNPAQQKNFKVREQKNPEQVVYISVNAASKTPGAAVNAAPNISPRLAQSLIQSNKQNYRSGQTITVTDGQQEFNFKRRGDRVIQEKPMNNNGKSPRRRKRSEPSAEGQLSEAEVMRGAY